MQQVRPKSQYKCQPITRALRDRFLATMQVLSANIVSDLHKQVLDLLISTYLSDPFNIITSIVQRACSKVSAQYNYSVPTRVSTVMNWTNAKRELYYRYWTMDIKVLFLYDSNILKVYELLMKSNSGVICESMSDGVFRLKLIIHNDVIMKSKKKNNKLVSWHYSKYNGREKYIERHSARQILKLSI